MKELKFIDCITEIIGSQFVGDDCAYLKDLGIVVTQDNLIENVHFSLDYATAFEIGYKSVMVNVSDIAASGAKPVYITIGLSLPRNTDELFVKEFYKGAKSACDKYSDLRIVGGDLTSASKICVSVCAIGNCAGRYISSRKNAKEGFSIWVKGVHGSSAMGLDLLINNKKCPEIFKTAHLKPYAEVEFSSYIAKSITKDYAMMDTSDGLMDALYKIADSSKQVTMRVDFNKIPLDSELKKYPNYEEFVLYGGEDFGLIAVLPEDFIPNDGVKIGEVLPKVNNNLVEIDFSGTIKGYTRDEILNKEFNHFE